MTEAAQRRYDHVCVINGGVVDVDPYAGGDKALQGNLELIAGSIYVDDTSRVVARGSGYQPRKCYHGEGPTDDSGGRGGCAVADSGGGGAHFGRGGRGTIDGPTAFPTHFEENCDDCSGGTCTHTWDEGNDECTSYAGCGVDANPCPEGRGGRICKEGPSVAGLPFWHNIYQPEFGAAGGDKGCRDDHGFTPTVGGAGGGRVVLVGLSHLTSVATSPCGPGLAAGEVRFDGELDASGKRGCGIGNDSGGGGAGGTVLVVGEHVTIGATAQVGAAGGLGGDTHAGASGSPDSADCVAGAQDSGTCDDCGGGGGGGIISVLSVQSDIDPAASFDVAGAAGGVCTICNGEAGGGAGELQLDGAYVGEFCDGYDNDFDGSIDEGLGDFSCGLGNCAQDVAACSSGVPTTCSPVVDSDPSCSEDTSAAKPRISVVLDTSASMLLDLSGVPTFGDGSEEHPGLPTDGGSTPDDSRLFLARESLAQVISAYPEIEFSLARYHQDQAVNRSCQTARWFECQDLVASYDDPTDNTGPIACSVEIDGSTIDVRQDPNTPEECINYAGSCGPPRRGADVLTGFGMPARHIVRWLDGRETNPQLDVTTRGNVCDHFAGGDCELRGTGPTPLAGSLHAIEDYMAPIRATDPLSACRSYTVILVTDGAESCNEDPVTAASQLHDNFGVEVFVVAVSVLPEEEQSLNDIANAGSGGSRTTATFVDQPQDLVLALTEIIAGSIRSETCNGADDDCDTLIDEDFPGLGAACDNGEKGTCRVPGQIVCNAAGDSTECNAPAGPPAGEEICNSMDDDCDGKLDESLSCTTTTCTELGSEICNGADDDCDEAVDEDDPAVGTLCGETEGPCEPGTQQCIGGMLQCVGAVPPGMEICNGLDDDCDGVADNDAPCPENSACIEGACRRRCDPDQEFVCPVGQECIQPMSLPDYYCVPTPCASCTQNERCVDDVCVDLCDDVSCEDGQTCVRGDCRDCHVVGCPGDEVCFAGQCQDDPCADTECGDGEGCIDGECVSLCSEDDCATGERCGEDGRCEDDPCADTECKSGEFCDEGECRANPCRTMGCVPGDVCVPALGCVDDPCPLVHCPQGASCQVSSDGEARCARDEQSQGKDDDDKADSDSEIDRSYVTTSGTGLSRCSAGQAGARAPGAGGLGALLLGSLLAVTLRRRRR